MNQPPSVSSDFFVAGGTLRPDAPSYVPRPTDARLHHLVQTGTLCYILTTRQMGKSSLMNRLGRQLQTEGVATALIDLTTIGTADQEAWYLSLLDDLQSQLPLTTDVVDWWQAQSSLSPVKRFTKFFRDVLLAEVAGPVAVFIDEVDSALKLDFSDDFFAAIRAIYNQTLTTPDAGRLSLVLMGVAAPNELIKGQHRTPFNIGERLELEELALADARAVFARGLPPEAAPVIDRVYDWTAGHPYLTQRLGQAMARDGRIQWRDQDVDDLVAQLFFGERALVEESNLQFVNGRVQASPQKERLLRLYKTVYRGQKIPNNDHAPEQTELKLIGLVKVDASGNLVVRNRIYQHAFDQAWIQQHIPARRQRLVWISLILMTLLAAATSLYFWRQAQRTDELLAQTYVANFSATENPTLRLDNLAQLLALGGYESEAVALFEQLPAPDKMALFTTPAADLQPQMERVITAVYTTQTADTLAAEMTSTPLLTAMLAALRQYNRLENPALAAEIESWLQGRTAVQQNNLDAAQLAYSVALSLNRENPATRYERAQVALMMGDNEAALADLRDLLLYGDVWQNRVAALVTQTPPLHSLITDGNRYPELVAFVPTPSAIASASVTAVMVMPGTPTVAPTQPPVTAVATSTPSVPLPLLADTPLVVPETPPVGDIVYTCFLEGVDQICIIAADGANQRQLTFTGVTDWAASLLPGGQGVLFSSTRSGRFAIYQADVTGENVRLVLPPGEGDYAPAASPDGRQIAFSRAEGSSLNIWIADSDGRNPRPLTRITGQAEALSPVWSPDGQQIAFTRRLAGEEGYTLVIIDADGSEMRELARPLPGIGGSVDWSPDGQWLAFYAGPPNDRDLYLLAVDGSVYHRLTDGGDNLSPSFSPDGNWLVFTSARDGDNDLYLMRLDGTGLTQLTVNTFSDWQPNWGSP
ncbi:MAG: AAA-like domain-containing protein [Anaerolineae bacterium]|nr:AAA-like domain-containing protein [Anaerolineae bacterium]